MEVRKGRGGMMRCIISRSAIHEVYCTGRRFEVAYSLHCDSCVSDTVLVRIVPHQENYNIIAVVAFLT